jgi:hypothetical protein
MSDPGDATETVRSQHRPGPPPRFTGRLVLQEEPEVIRRLEQAAELSGHSVAAEIRAAVRWWLKETE